MRSTRGNKGVEALDLCVVASGTRQERIYE